ncbi:MAG: hypothetical protein HOH58_06280 [Opitutaceae bacterium]|nr:hypothetical protein [Opitutaceae bacterium]
MTDPNLSIQWDEARTAFASSIMVDTALSSLAENLDGPEWPGKGKKDSPSDYIDLGYEEAIEMIAMRGYPDGTMADLITIFNETLAFDDPFGDMVEQSESSSANENPIVDNLAKLEIPGGFPIRLTSLSKDAQEFCGLEGLTSVIEFAIFAQGMSQNVIVGGDFKTLLNALSHVDEESIAKFLPFRPGKKGLHLIEGIGGIVRTMRDMDRQKLNNDDPLSNEITGRVAELVKYFADDLELIKTNLESGIELNREVMVLQDPAIEPLVIKLLQDYLPSTEAPKKSGWFGRLFGG